MWQFQVDHRVQVGENGPVVGPHVVRIGTFDDENMNRHGNDPVSGDMPGYREQLQQAIDADQEIIPVVIDSDGGSVDVLFGLYDELDVARRRGFRICTVVVGRACSAGADLLASGDPGLRFASPTSRIMVHYGHEDVISSTVHNVTSNALEVKRFYDQSFEIFNRNCGKPPGHFEGLLRARDQTDWYMSPSEALRHGIVDHVGIPDFTVRLLVTYEVTVPPKRKAKR